MSKKKIRSICIDTLTGIQNELYMTALRSPSFDKWADFGKDIWRLHSDLTDLGFHSILVLGEPGVGKSYGQKFLESGTNIWFNADNKNPTWIGGKQEYGTKSSPKSPYHIIPKSYQDITSHIVQGIEGGMFEDERFAIITGHLEDYKQGNDVRSRLKVLGNIATKMHLEGKFDMVLYAKVIKEGGSIKYVFETQNNGYNTARSIEGLFEPVIDNNYDLIIKKLLE